MSVCTLIASDFPLPTVVPPLDYPLHINLDDGTIEDGGADDNYYLRSFPEAETYTGRQYAVCLEWNATAGRADRIIEYIRNALVHTPVLEFWHIWLMGYWEFEDRPFLHRKTVPIDALTAKQIREIDAAEIWNTPDRQYPDRPSFYCLTITR